MVRESFEVIVECVTSTRYIVRATTPNEAEQAGERLAEERRKGEVLDVEVLSVVAAPFNEDEGEVEPRVEDDEDFDD